jgi:hypothetical protein
MKIDQKRRKMMKKREKEKRKSLLKLSFFLNSVNSNSRLHKCYLTLLSQTNPFCLLLPHNLFLN